MLNSASRNNVYGANIVAEPINQSIIARVHEVHAINAELGQLAADLCTKPTVLSRKSVYTQLVNHIQYCDYLHSAQS